MTRFHKATKWPVVLFFFLCFLTGLAAAADTITVGSVAASTSTVRVPIHIRDASGTTLGVDQAAGSKIQAFSIKVSYAPASSVQSVSIRRDGITENLTPIFETKPSSSGAISIVVSFDEANNLIPFTLNAPLPGNQVAELVFTLSPGAPPESSIALTLDPALTQLTDAGGTSATKETEANGRLELVNGAIDIPPVSVSLSPDSRIIAPGGVSLLSAVLSSVAASSTTITLSSSDPTIASVPTSVVIPAGSTSANFDVTAGAVGSATITATLGASTATATIDVINEPPPCNAPAAPQLNVPSTGTTGVPYSVSWAPTEHATEYLLEESSSQSFTTLVTRSTTESSASFTQNAEGVRYYRVRARNHAGNCDLYSSYSTLASITISATPVPMTRIIPVVGSLPGNFGSYFRTSLQLYNPHSTAISGKLVFHPAGIAGSQTDPALAYSMLPGKTLSYTDLLPAMGVANGIGSADLVADAGSPFPVALARLFNDAGAAGTSGLGEEPLPLERALETGDTGVLLAPDDVLRFRLNIGLRSLGAGVAMTITVRDKEGVIVKQTTMSYPAHFFIQSTAADLLDGYVLSGGATISFHLTSGSAFIYGATTDNTTNDPSVQFAASID